MIRREKGFELMKFSFITDLSTFGSNMLLALKTMDLRNFGLNRSCSYLCD
jgi:hypothetical protein